MTRIGALFLACMMAAGCAHGPSQDPAMAAQSDAAPDPSATGSPGPAPSPAADHIGTLPSQSLPAGECGMFLWPKRVNARLLLFSLSSEASARIALDGQEREFPRVSAEGQSYYGQYPRQVFAGDGYEVQVRVVADPGEGVVNGALVRRASVKVIGSDGWQYVLPAAGLIACEPPD